MIVVDVNILAYYLIQGERTPAAGALRKRDDEWIVPSFWSVEFQNILWKYTMCGGMPMAKALEVLDHALAMLTANEVSPRAEMVLSDAVKWGISAYDAQYVSLARQFGVPCVTEDRQVQKACPAIAMSIEDFLGGRASRGVVREGRTTYRARRKG